MDGQTDRQIGTDDRWMDRQIDRQVQMIDGWTDNDHCYSFVMLLASHLN